MEFNANVWLPWLILGDYNNVLKFDEKCNGADVTPYEIKDLTNCCLHVGLTDVCSIVCYYKWTNGSVWSKSDRAIVNDIWVQNGAYVDANFLLSGCLSDHSPCIVSIHDRVGSAKTPFKFFNKRTKHEDFHDLIQASMNFNIKETLFRIEDDKSPRPDGYTSCLFKSAWGCIEHDFVEAIMEFFSSGSILKQINHAVIALVQNSSHNPSFGDYRPISCCNVICKVITKTLASRLRPILGDIVDQAQTAFIECRSMTENIHLAQELLRQYNRKRVTSRCLLKIDIRKAYDLVSWDFLKSVLEGLNFPLRFTQWAMECVTSPTYSVALNESMHGFFKGGKGLQEGDPLSPFLFVLYLEYFSRMIKDATNDSDFNYHLKCGPLKITHLAFANHLTLFARRDAMLVEILMNCLDNFGLASGLKINTLKSSLYTTGIYGFELQRIVELSNFSKGTMPFCYFGIPLASEKLKVSSYAPFLDKIAAYIGAWNCSSLSYASKVELITAVLNRYLLNPFGTYIIKRTLFGFSGFIKYILMGLAFGRDILCEKGAAQQIFPNGQLVPSGQMDNRIILPRSAGLALNYHARHPQNMGQTG
ncbi:uncharacterized protein LOC111386969 [Olea europaea var. sylvestris]|uniref:uncharacterized protein LOC111386969 n=1 Tax=Olea europaea var. sylvestris TaxID=158386 RepID=UPI000C1D3FBD|nr:uncharacterized protein LOC111386969 [Olea europaea var. sylvestris]